MTNTLGNAAPPVLPTRIASVRMRDGVKIAAAVYLPKGAGRFPALLAASPYRFDNNLAPALPVFLWRETGPIEWYLGEGYAFVHMDVRGTGRSGGEYRYMCRKEQRDLVEVIAWITGQKWSNGRVGGIGQSYYARMQWCMAVHNPPGLACIAPYDGNVDTYRASAYTGGIPGEYPASWFNRTLRAINASPAAGPRRLIDWDYANEVRKHPTYDAFWKERAPLELLHKARAPAFSIGVWRKVDLHLNGNIVGFQRYGGPKKLLVFGSGNLHEAVQAFSSIAFHEKWLLPFYDLHLKGKATGWENEPAVRWYVGGTAELRSDAQWPPNGIRYCGYYLRKGPSGGVKSLNDGALSEAPPDPAEPDTVFDYPDPGWRMGVVGLAPGGRPADPVRHVLTFAGAPLEEELEIAGPIKLELWASSSREDTDFIVKISEQYTQSEEDAAQGLAPRAQVITKGWLRASHRAIARKASTEYAPWYPHDKPQKLRPGRTYRFEIAVMPTAHRFRKGSRIRLEIANGDSSVTEQIFAHEYSPAKVGRDTIHHDSARPSRLYLPKEA